MKKISLILILLFCFGPGMAWGDGDDPFKALPKKNDPFQSESQKKSTSPVPKEAGLAQQISYSLGFDIFSHISDQVDLDLEYFLMGIEDAQKKSPRLTGEQMRQMLMAYQRLARQKARQENRAVLEKNLAEGNVFLEGNKLKQGVVSLSSGLQYKVIKEGEGPVPTEESTVECHYKGMLIDGTPFDSSYDRGRPAVFQVSKVIAGWTQALVRMPSGSKWKLFIPSDLAYGEQGAGQIIQPGHTLVFEVELLGIIE